MGSLAAIVIAGGESRRFGADKLALCDAQGRVLLEVTVAGVAQSADPGADRCLEPGPRRCVRHRSLDPWQRRAFRAVIGSECVGGEDTTGACTEHVHAPRAVAADSTGTVVLFD